MSSWKPSFDAAVASFRQKKYDEALTQVSEAIRQGADRANVYDLRANILSECLNRPKEALKDAKMVIKLCPESPKGYLRAAQIFFKMGSMDPATKMAEHALKCTSIDNPSHNSIRQSVAELQAEISKKSCHVSKLPIELLTSIFELASSLYPNESNSASIHGYFGGRRNPRLGYDMSRVCRYWRRAALEHPPIWRTLVIGNRKPSAKVQLWANRTNSNLEELIIQPDMHAHLLAEVAKSLAKHFSSPPSIIRCSSDAWTPLEIAMYQQTRPIEVSLTTSAGDNLTYIPHLRTLDLQSLALDRIVALWEPANHSFARMKFLKLNRPLLVNGHHETLMDRLAEAEFLEFLIIERDPLQQLTPSQTAQSRIVHASLPNLRHLELARFTNEEVQLLFGRFDFPHLEVLHLFNIPRACASLQTLRRRLPPPPESGAIETNLELEPSALQVLRVRSCTFETSDLIASLGTQCQNIRVLEVSGAGMDINPLLEALAGDRLPAPICPHVKEFNFTRSPTLTGAPLKKLVKSRIPNDDQSKESDIKSLIIDGCPKIESQLLPWLWQKVKRGSCVYETGKEIRKTRR